MQVVAVIAAALVGTAAAGGYGPAPVQPVYPVPQPGPKPCPTPLAQPVAPVAPVVVAPVAPTATVTVVAPVVTKPKAKVHTCGGWNKKYNKKGCASVNEVKCTLGSGKGSKYQPCSAAVCCGSSPAPPAPTPVPTGTVTIVSCATYCSTNSYQCAVITSGSCGVEGPSGQYLQCSKALCCGTPAPQPPAPQPRPQIVPCSSIVNGYGSWPCNTPASYSCAVGAAYGPYPACSFGVCCINTPKPNPCGGCNSGYGNCPSYCDPCNNCGNYCPPSCNGQISCSAYNPCPGVGTTCQNGICVPVVPTTCNPPCQLGTTCNPNTLTCDPIVPPGTCATDADCGAGQVCDTVSGQCVAAPSGGCTSDSDCGANQTCDTTSGQCIDNPPDVGCQTDADCASGSCIDNICV